MVATLEAPSLEKITPDKLLRMTDQGKGLELVDGEFVDLEMSFLSSFVAGEAYAPFAILSINAASAGQHPKAHPISVLPMIRRWFALPHFIS